MGLGPSNAKIPSCILYQLGQPGAPIKVLMYVNTHETITTINIMNIVNIMNKRHHHFNTVIVVSHHHFK